MTDRLSASLFFRNRFLVFITTTTVTVIIIVAAFTAIGNTMTNTFMTTINFRTTFRIGRFNRTVDFIISVRTNKNLINHDDHNNCAANQCDGNRIIFLLIRITDDRISAGITKTIIN